MHQRGAGQEPVGCGRAAVDGEDAHLSRGGRRWSGGARPACDRVEASVHQSGIFASGPPGEVDRVAARTLPSGLSLTNLSAVASIQLKRHFRSFPIGSSLTSTPPHATCDRSTSRRRLSSSHPQRPSDCCSMAEGDGAGAAATGKLAELPSGAEKGLPRRGKASSGRTLNTAQIPLVASHPDVYEPCDDSFALVDALLSDKAQLLTLQPRLCMEVGSGSGYVITSLAIMLRQLGSGAQYLATDINQHAAETTQATLEAHGVHADVIVTDIVSGLDKRLAGMVDVAVVNPPYVPTPVEEVGCKGIASSWAGGLNGRQVIDRILPAVREMLSERGWLYMVALEDNDPSDICHLMSEMGYASRVVLKRCTEEESLYVFKFWRDPHAVSSASPKSSGSESWFSQLPFKSLWHKNS